MNFQNVTVAQYFSVVGVLTSFITLSLIWQSPACQQNIKEVLGLAEPIEAKPDSFYEQRVAVIFEKYCIGCHGADKAKGHLRMDSFKHTVFGGKSGDMLAGAEQSLLFQRMSLPEENRLAMPPFGRDRQTADEMKVIQMWLNKGASGHLTELDFPDAPSKPKVIQFAKVDEHAIQQKRAPIANKVKALQQQYPFVLSYVARTSNELILQAQSIRHFTDADLQAFSDVSDFITEVDLSGSQITDEAVDTLLQMKNLSKLVLKNTQVSAKGLRQLVKIDTLQRFVVPYFEQNNEWVNKLTQQGVSVVQVRGL